MRVLCDARRPSLPGAICAICTVLVLLCSPAGSQVRETARPVTYGASASAEEGDDDNLQVFFFSVAAERTAPVFIRLFDADTGGVHDQLFEEPDTSTRFSLYGGIGAGTAATVCLPHPQPDDLIAGALLAQETYTQDAALDNEWYTFAEVDPSGGEEIGDKRVFRLVVEGIAGDDGNVFDVALSSSPRRNRRPEGVQLVSHAPTIRLHGEVIAAELAFTIPADTRELTVGVFDAGGARVTFDSTFRSLELSTSGQGTLSESTVMVQPQEQGQRAAVTMGVGGGENPNDASFYVTATGSPCPLPIELPVRAARRNRRPQVQLQTEPLADCFSYVLDATGTSDEDGDLLQYDWQLGDGSSDRGKQLVHRYDAPGTYHGVLQVRDTSGAAGNGTLRPFMVVINQAPVAEAGADIVGEPGQELSFDGSASHDADGTVLEHSWDFADDGATAEGETVHHTYGEPGRYLVSLRVKDDSDSPCNFASDFLTVWVNYPPVAEVGEDIICSVGETITLDGSRSYDTDGTITSYAWDLGDGNRSSTATVEHAYQEPGRYRVSLQVADDAGARNSSASDSLMVLVNDPPVAAAGADKWMAVGQVSVFDGSESLDRDGKVMTYHWDFGDGNTGEGRVIPYAYSAPGTYTVTLTVRDNSPVESGVDSDTLTVMVNAPPEAQAGNDKVVTASVVAFDGTTSSDPDGSVLNYEWDFGDGTTGSGADPEHVYTRPGMYAVTLRVKDDSGTPMNESVDRLTVVVNERPIADAGPDKIIAPGEPVVLHAYDSFDPDGEIIEFSWSFGDGESADGRSVSHTYQQPGVYTVRLSVVDDTEDANAVDYDEAIVTVNAAPTAVPGPAVLAAPGQEITFDGSGSFDPDGQITSYEWRFSDSQGAASAAVTSRTFDTPGIYTATLLVIDDSSASNDLHRASVPVTINHQPRAVPGRDVSTCDSAVSFDGSSSLDADGDALTYRWDFGDGQVAHGVSVSHIFAEGGSYPVTLTVDDGTGLTNARHAAAMTVAINRPPLANAGSDMQVCAGEVALFDGSASADPEGGLLRYLWELGDGTTFEGVHPTKIYTEGGVYTVRLTVHDDSGLPCSSDTTQITVRVAESPVADAGPDLVVCASQRIRFDGTASRDFDGVVNRYLWDFGDGSIGGGSTPEHIFTEPGEYRVQLTVTGDQVGSCDNTDNDEVTVTVLSAPVAVIAGPDRIPVGAAITLDASASSAEGANIIDFQWDLGDGTVGQGPQVTHTYATAGHYVASLQISTDAEVACHSVGTQRTLVVNQAPVAVAGDPQLVGVNQLVMLNASGSFDDDGAIVSYHWDFGDGEEGAGVISRHRYQRSGSYQVVLTVTDDAGLANSTVTDTVTVTVNQAPVPVIDAPPSACAGEEVQLRGTASSDGDGEILAYTWSFGDGQWAEGSEVAHVFSRHGRYHVTLTVDDGAGVSNSRQETAMSLPVNAPPVALAGPDVTGCTGQPITFNGSASTDSDGELVRFWWSFGDGGEAAGEGVTHSYDEPGRYQAALTVTDDLGGTCGSASDSRLVRINTPPLADAGPDLDAFVGGAHDAVLFDGSSSADADGDPLTFLWDFGDGSSDAGPKVFHSFREPGEYTVRLTVADGSGTTCAEATDEVLVTVRER